jgi:tRNA 2-thiouridine synthesizing protein A
MPLDPRGPNCPFPALRTRKMLSWLAYGDRLSVKCTDPLAVNDIPHRLRETGDSWSAGRRRGVSFLYSMSSAEKHESNIICPWPTDAGSRRRRYSGSIMEKPSIPHLIFAFSLRLVAGFAATIYRNICPASPLMGFHAPPHHFR